MTDPRRQAFAPYLRCLADRMELRDWTVSIADAPPDDPALMAQCFATFGRRRATVAVSDEFLDDDGPAQRQTLVHELIHCHFRPMEQLLADMLRDHPAASAYVQFLEYGIDAVADAMAGHLPLPDGVRPA